MSIHTEFGDRMKKYENISRNYLCPKTPVIIRLDGKAFHTFTKGFKRPFDDIMVKSMQATMKYLCENIQGCVFGYTQSDEISLVLVDYKNLKSSGWFDYNIQKCASIAASMATMAFNKFFPLMIEKCLGQFFFETETDEDTKYVNSLMSSLERGALFDARVFNIPKEEVVNCIYWRQQDAIRNSILSVSQAHFSHKEIQNKNTSVLVEMLREKGVIWEDFAPTYKQGSACFKETYFIEISTGREVNDYELRTKVFDSNKLTERSRWVIDNDMPILLNEGRDYLAELVEF